MSQSIVYILNSNGNLGCFPECVVVDTDDKGQFSVNYVKITEQNKSNFSALFDDIDEKLLFCCLKLEKDVIVSKLSDKETRTWNGLITKYFEGSKQKKQLKFNILRII